MTKKDLEKMNAEDALQCAYSGKAKPIDMLLYIYLYQMKNNDLKYESLFKEWIDLTLIKNPEVFFLHGMTLLEIGEKDRGKEYIFKAAEKHNHSANFFLADSYMFGEKGFEKDEQKALAFYINACKYGERMACQNVYKLLKKKHEKAEAIEIMGNEIGYGRLLLSYLFPIKGILLRFFPKN